MVSFYKSSAQAEMSIAIWPTGNKGTPILVPFNCNGYSLCPAYASAHYPIAVAPKMQDGYGSKSLLLFDLSKNMFIGEIALPSEAKGTRPYFFQDRENDVLLAAAYDLNWLLAVDLKPYMDKLRQAGWKPPVTAPPEKQAAQP